MRLKENSLLLPARFLLGRKKGRAKSHVYYLDLLAHPLGGFCNQFLISSLPRHVDSQSYNAVRDSLSVPLPDG